MGVAGAIFHAWSEKAFTTNLFLTRYSPMASFFGVPYWLFGVIWFPLVLAVSIWTTRLGRSDLNKELLILLTIGNVFTGYLWYLDIMVVRAYTLVYVGLYATNYVLTGLVVFQNWRNDAMRGFFYGTVVGAIIGLFFGPLGVAACGIAGGIFGAIRNYAVPKKTPPRVLQHVTEEIHG